MKRNILSYAVLVVAFVIGSVGMADAQKRNDREVRDAVRSLSSRIDDFEADLRYQMQSSSANNIQVSGISDEIRSLRDNVRQFQDNLDRRRENRDDVNQIIDSARPIELFLRSNSQNNRVQTDWDGVKKQLDRLANNYGVSPNWNDVEDPPQNVRDYPIPPQNNTISVGLSGTYNLDTARSESVDDVLSNANLTGDQRQDLKEKLVSPEQIAVDIRGNQVIVATSTSKPLTLIADGRENTEKSPAGANVRTRATLNGQILTLASLGGETDYTITFTSVSNGQVMKVTRRITTDYLNQTVFTESVYNKSDQVARLGIDRNVNNNTGGGYSDNDQNPTGQTNGQYGNAPSTATQRTGNFVVPNGTVMSGVLENEINTKASQNNDRFRLTVQSPNDFRGAVIDGYISGVNRSGKATGRSTVTFNFEKITLRNGQTYDFAGNLQSITDQTGKSVKVDSEGSVKGGSQTTQTAKRGGIGAGIGAVIGAIAGGGTGAAIGAVIGGTAGAGTAVLDGRADIQLMKGSTITLQSSSPIRQNQPDN